VATPKIFAFISSLPLVVRLAWLTASILIFIEGARASIFVAAWGVENFRPQLEAQPSASCASARQLLETNAM
jgi:hypothetical protein